jgi:lipid A 3-O-deacylase
MYKSVMLVLVVSLAGIIRAGQTVDAVSVGIGQSTDHIDVFRVGVRSDFGRSWDDQVSGFFEASVNEWHKNNDDVWCGAFSPVFTYHPGCCDFGACKSYLYGGIGVAAISKTKVTKDRNMASVFQFEDRIGVGLTWRRLDFDLGFIHYSNGGFSMPNQGINIHILTVTYRF